MRHDIFINYQNFKIFFTFLLFWMGIQFGSIVEDSIAFFLVITIGILHGANDLLVLSKHNSTKRTLLSKNFLIYLILMLLCVMFFFLDAFLAIIMFLIISSFHFGEEHFSEIFKQNSIFKYLYFLNYGLVIFGMLFYNSPVELKSIMIDLVGFSFNTLWIDTSLIITTLLFVILSLYYVFRKVITIKVVLKETLFLVFLFLVFKTTSLIFGFAIYFILWHSIPSIIHQVLFLSGSFTKKTMTRFVKKAILYWLISAVGIILLYVLTPNIELFSSSLFAVLFAVTAPHMWVMSKMKVSE